MTLLIEQVPHCCYFLKIQCILQNVRLQSWRGHDCGDLAYCKIHSADYPSAAQQVAVNIELETKRHDWGRPLLRIWEKLSSSSALIINLHIFSWKSQCMCGFNPKDTIDSIRCLPDSTTKVHYLLLHVLFKIKRNST